MGTTWQFLGRFVSKALIDVAAEHHDLSAAVAAFQKLQEASGSHESWMS